MKIKILNNSTLPVDFIMHEYLHKYFENIKNWKKNSFRNMRPLSNVSPPSPAGGTGVLPSALFTVRNDKHGK